MFKHNLFHEVLYRFHVLGESSLPNPGYPPYYDENFFSVIRDYHHNSDMNITMLTTKQWYKMLLDDQVLKSPATDNSPPTLLPVRAETLHPQTDWPLSWHLCRARGLSSDNTSFLFKLLHLLLPTQSRALRLGADRDGSRGRCQLCAAEDEDLQHAFFICPSNKEAGLSIIQWTQRIVPDLTPDASLRLDFGDSLNPGEQLAATSIIATGLRTIWLARSKKERVDVYRVRAEIEALISLLRRSRHQEVGDRIEIAICLN